MAVSKSGRGYSAKKKTGSWSSGNKTGKTASQAKAQRNAAEGPKRSMKTPQTRKLKHISDYRGAEGPKKSMPRAGVGKGGGRGVAANKPSGKKRGK